MSRYPIFDPEDPTQAILNAAGVVLTGVHPAERCEGQPCVIHHPSDHHMRDWPLNWRQDRGLMERICPHGVGHPDPDDVNPDTVHGCDGCCRELVAS